MTVKTTGANVRLLVRGRRFAGWKRVSVSASLDRMCRTWELEATDLNVPVIDPPGSPLLMRPGDPVELYVGSVKLLTGYLDTAKIAATATSNTITISGRSKTEDVADCSPVSRRAWRNEFIGEIVGDLAAPYNVEVVTEVDTGPPLRKFKVQRDESCASAIDRLAKKRGLIVTDDELGRLVITRAGTTRATSALSLGVNVLESEGVYDASQLFSEYWCRGQPALATEVDAALIAHAAARVFDDTIDRERVLILPAEGKASAKRCEERATHEAAVRAGQSTQINVRTNGWTQADGSLWRPNLLVRYTDLLQGVIAELLTVDATYELDDQAGETTRLRLAPASGYELLSEPERKARRGRGQKKAATAGVGLWKELDPTSTPPPPKRPASKKWTGLTNDVGKRSTQ